MSDHPGLALPKPMEDGGDGMGVIIAFSGNSSPKVSLVVNVSFDSGAMMDPDGNEV